MHSLAGSEGILDFPDAETDAPNHQSARPTKLSCYSGVGSLVDQLSSRQSRLGEGWKIAV